MKDLLQRLGISQRLGLQRFGPRELAMAGVIALTTGVVGRFTYLFVTNPGSHTYRAPKSDLKSADHIAGGITVTVVDNTSATPCPNPLEAVLTQAQDYVAQHSWQEIEQHYAGVPGGVIVSLHDYQGNSKEQACRLALGRLVETTIGSVVDRTNSKYQELTDAVITKGLTDCTKDMQLRYKNYRFGL